MISIFDSQNSLIDTKEGFRTTIRIIFDEGYDTRGLFCDWGNLTGKRDHKFIQPGSRDFDNDPYHKLESWSFDRFSVKWVSGLHQPTCIPFQLNFQGYAGSLCKLDIVTVGLFGDLPRGEDYLSAHCMVQVFSDGNSKNHSRAPAGEKAHKFQSQTTLLTTEIKPLGQSSRSESFSVPSHSSSKNSTLRGPAKYDPSEQNVDLYEPFSIHRLAIILMIWKEKAKIRKERSSISSFHLPRSRLTVDH